MAYVLDVEAHIKDDPTGGAPPGAPQRKITLTPEADGCCQATSMLVVGRLSWKTRKPRKGGPSEAFEVVEIFGCAGRI